jgi:hypothetical protein
VVQEEMEAQGAQVLVPFLVANSEVVVVVVVDYFLVALMATVE